MGGGTSKFPEAHPYPDQSWVPPRGHRFFDLIEEEESQFGAQTKISVDFNFTFTGYAWLCALLLLYRLLC